MHKSDLFTMFSKRGMMDIDLLDKNDQIIDKDSRLKENNNYTALLKALVDESGIKFPGVY
jgi:DNA sulfur modification protein DndD